MEKTVSNSSSQAAQAIIAGLVTSSQRSDERSARRNKVDHREAIALYLAGVTVADIAQHFNVDKSTVYEHLRAAGVTPKRKTRSDKGVRRKLTSEDKSSGPSRNPSGGKLTPHIIAKIISLHEQGYKAEAIAEYVGVSKSTAFKYIAQHRRRHAKKQVHPAEIQASIVVTQPGLWSRIKSWFA